MLHKTYIYFSNDKRVTVKTNNIKIHEDYDETTFINDICIIDLKSGGQPNIRLPKIYYGDHKNPENINSFFIGFDTPRRESESFSFRSFYEVLLKVWVKMVPLADCGEEAINIHCVTLKKVYGDYPHVAGGDSGE